MDVDCTINYIKVHPPTSLKHSDYRLNWRILPETHTVSSFPLHLDIELTNKCNLSCNMCAFHANDAKFKMEPQDMHFSLYKKIIDEGSKKGLCAIKLNYSGEPLMYPHIIDAIKYAKRMGIIDVTLNTNGTFLNNEMSTNLIKAGLDKLIISDYKIDAIREKLITLQSIKQIHGVKTPLVRVQRLIPKGETKEEVEKYLKEKWDNIADELATQLMLDYNSGKKIKKESDFECAFPWQRMLILADGTVLSCCGMPHKSKILGDMHNNRIGLLWHSNYMEDVRDKMKNKESHLIKACVSCPMRIKLIDD